MTSILLPLPSAMAANVWVFWPYAQYVLVDGKKNLHAIAQLIRNIIGQMECAPSSEFGVGVRCADFWRICAQCGRVTRALDQNIRFQGTCAQCGQVTAASKMGFMLGRWEYGSG